MRQPGSQASHHQFINHHERVFQPSTCRTAPLINLPSLLFIFILPLLLYSLELLELTDPPLVGVGAPAHHHHDNIILGKVQLL